MSQVAWGIDYSFSKPAMNKLPGAGVKFIVRYLSYDPSKNLRGPG